MGTQSRRVVHEKPAPRVASEVKVIPLFWYLSSHRFRRTRLQNRPRQTRGMWLWGAEVVVQRLTVRVCATLGRRRRDSGSGRGLHTQQRGMSARLKTTHAGRGGAKRRSQGFRFKKLCVDKQHGGSQRWIFLTIIPITPGRAGVLRAVHTQVQGGMLTLTADPQSGPRSKSRRTCDKQCERRVRVVTICSTHHKSGNVST